MLNYSFTDRNTAFTSDNNIFVTLILNKEQAVLFMVIHLSRLPYGCVAISLTKNIRQLCSVNQSVTLLHNVISTDTRDNRGIFQVTRNIRRTLLFVLFAMHHPSLSLQQPSFRCSYQSSRRLILHPPFVSALTPDKEQERRG